VGYRVKPAAIPYQKELSNMMMGSLASGKISARERLCFNWRESCWNLFKSFPGQMAPQYQAPKTVDPYGPLYQQAVSTHGIACPN